MHALSQGAKLVRHSNAVAAGATTITPSAGVDTRGYEGCLFVAALGTIAPGAATSIEVHQSSDDGGTDDYTALAGSKVTIPDDGDNKLYYVDVSRSTKRYVKLIVNRATANATLDGIVALLYGAHDVPVTHDSTVGAGELHVTPAEGTA